MKKRPIKEVRDEIWQLEHELDHDIIANSARGEPGRTTKQQEIIDKVAALKEAYPNWDANQRKVNG